MLFISISTGQIKGSNQRFDIIEKSGFEKRAHNTILQVHTDTQDLCIQTCMYTHTHTLVSDA